MTQIYLIVDWDSDGNPVPRMAECFPITHESDTSYIYAVDGLELTPIRIMGKYSKDAEGHCSCPCSDGP